MVDIDADVRDPGTELEERNPNNPVGAAEIVDDCVRLVLVDPSGNPPRSRDAVIGGKPILGHRDEARLCHCAVELGVRPGIGHVARNRSESPFEFEDERVVLEVPRDGTQEREALRRLVVGDQELRELVQLDYPCLSLFVVMGPAQVRLRLERVGADLLRVTNLDPRLCGRAISCKGLLVSSGADKELGDLAALTGKHRRVADLEVTRPDVGLDGVVLECDPTCEPVCRTDRVVDLGPSLTARDPGIREVRAHERRGAEGLERIPVEAPVSVCDSEL